MIQFRTTDDRTIHASKNAIKEVIFNSTDKSAPAIIVTEKNKYYVSASEAMNVVNACKENDYLAHAINNLTNMIRARIH